MMKFTLALVLAIFVVDVKPLIQEAADVVFKKYATLKILEDCYGKQTVNLMLTEVGLAYAKCRGQPSFLPLLEQMLMSSQIPVAAEVDKAQEVVKETVPIASPPAEDAVPLVVYQRPLKPPTAPYPWMGFGYGSYDVRNLMLHPSYYPPHPYPYQERFPSPHGNYFNNGPIVHPAGYRWKRDSEEPVPVTVDDAEQTTQQSDDDLSTETEIPEDVAPVTIKPAKQPFSFASFMTNKLISKHQYIIGNMTCVLKEIGFIGEDMQPNFDSIRSRINQLSVSNDLKTDLFDGIQMCQQFSSCVPAKAYGNVRVISELVRPYVFFKCFKGRKIEACMKKDLRDKFGGLLSGITANQDKQRSGGPSEREDKSENIENIFNMVYGFDMDAPSDGFF